MRLKILLILIVSLFTIDGKTNDLDSVHSLSGFKIVSDQLLSVSVQFDADYEEDYEYDEFLYHRVFDLLRPNYSLNTSFFCNQILSFLICFQPSGLSPPL